ncbi:MAG: 16S rRNA (uracil(1498)-N(3))-methyltransferase [Bacteroidales bacterium]|nr:16S rRNA (uracil(1498)-N(3))-methyltransferase [Bacteroidales bacterium]
MEIFYSGNIGGMAEGGRTLCTLSEEESAHCIRVLRHRSGDEINVIDGEGDLLCCRIVDDSPKGAVAEILERIPGWGGHQYNLTMAVCPTKNMDRYEWFCEKVTEIGVDTIVPLIGDHSERKVVKTERLSKILLSATKQSLKGKIPAIGAVSSVKDFIKNAPEDSLKLIAYCFEDGSVPRKSVKSVLGSYSGKDIIIMIGPEGDFSKEEALLALSCGFIPVHLGESRLRTETAAVVAASAVYFHNMD